MKSLENPLEESAKKELLPKYSFLLLLAFEGAIRTRNCSNLKSIIQDASSARCSLRVFESMADLILSNEDEVPQDIALQTMQVRLSLGY